MTAASNSDSRKRAAETADTAPAETLAEREVQDIAVTIAALLAGRCDGQQAVATTVAQVERIIAARIVQARAGEGAPGLPFVLRVPGNRVSGNAVDLNVGTEHRAVPVELDPGLDPLGECRWDVPTYTGNGPRIVLREWNEQVFLHELLHVVLDPVLPPSLDHGHDVISRVEVALWETRWRYRPGQARAGEGALRMACAWEEGYAAGHSNAMRRMSDEPNAPTSPNPYAVLAEGDPT